MIPINEVSVGNWVQVNLDGQLLTGKVQRKSVERIGVLSEAELGWYLPRDVYPIPLNEEWLYFLDFKDSTDPELMGEGKAYVHGPFILHYPNKDDDSYAILSCHGVHDQTIKRHMGVHDLQNHYNEMTKVPIG